MRKPVTWTAKIGHYASGANAMIGPYIVGEVFYISGSQSDPDKKRWRPEIKLPGLAIKYGLRFETQEEARECIERVIAKWFAVIDE